MNRIVVNLNEAKARISRHIYGHFSEHLGRCIYGGYWVGDNAGIPNVRGIRTDIVDALKKIRIPNLRWPGGCFADEYHWEDGIGQRELRPKMVNTHWGGVTEDNSFGTHEFLDLCEQLSDPAVGKRCEPVICGNVGSGTVREMAQWVEYCNFDGVSPMADLRKKNGREKPWGVKFWGVGNESWGCGGNMTAEFYADNYRRYATYVRNYAGVSPFKIACGASDGNYDWTRVLMEKAGGHMNGLSLHHYTIPGDWGHRGSATAFGEGEWRLTMQRAYHMEELVRRHSAVMDEFDSGKRVRLVVDEWGTWYDVEPGTNPGFLYQQNTLRDALVAGINFNIFNNSCERVGMANIAQTVNVLQAVVLTEGAKMLLTPTYHAFDMYKVHHDAVKIPVYVESDSYGSAPAITASASEDDGGRLHVSLTNSDPQNEKTLRLEFRGGSPEFSGGSIITSEKMNDMNTFDESGKVVIKSFSDAKTEGRNVTVNLPSKSVVTLELA
jgi:alpha-N-arabinofuranosidase